MAVANVVAKFEADISDVQAKMAALKQSFKQVTDSTNSMSDRLQQVGTSMATVGRKMTLGVSLPLAAIGAASVKTAMDFETSMSKIEGLVGVASDEVASMGETILETSAQFGVGANEAANALFFITSAGLRGADAMDVLEASMKASQVGLGDVATVADLATSAMNAYGPEVLSATSATDVLTTAVREGKLEAEELAGSMGRVLPIASAMGVNFDEVGAAMAAMSRTGTNAAEASTQLRGILSSILRPTVQAEEALSGMGLSAEGLRAQIKEQGLLATLQTLSEEFQGNDAAAAQVFGNVRALAGVMDLMGANAETTAAIFDSLTQSAGATDAAFAVTAETAEFRMNQALAEMKTALIEVGEAIMPVATTMIDFAKTALQAFNNLPGPIKTIAVAFGGLLAAMGPILWIGGKIITMLGVFSAAWKRMRDAAVTSITSIRTSVKTMNADIKTAMIGARTQMGALAAAARVMGASVVGVFRSIGAAAKGLMASLGPVGFAIIGVSVAYELLAGKSAEAEARVEALTQALSEQGPTAEKAAAEVIAAALLANEWGGFLWIEGDKQNFQDLADIAGVSMAEITAAVIAGGAQMEAVISDFRAAGEEGLIDPLRAGEAIQSINAQRDAYVEATRNVQIGAEAIQIANATSGKSAREMAGQYRTAAREMTDSQETLRDAVNDGVRAVEALETAFTNLNKALSDEASLDGAKRALLDLNEELTDGDKNLKGYTAGALDNREAIRQAAQAWMDYAAATQDPEEAQERLKQGQKEIKAALKEAGVNPQDSDIFRILKEQQQQSGETVDEFAKQRDKAAQYGNDVGNNFIDGIIRELERRRTEVANAAAAATNAMNTGGNAGIDAKSPSRTAMEIGKNFTDGLVIGLRRGSREVESEASKAAKRIANQFMSLMQPTGGGAATNAFEAMFGTREDIRNSARALEDATWELADARDAVVDAEKALAEARKEGNAREIAAAERDLARARRDAADAADAKKTAEFTAENRKALLALRQIVEQYDYINAAMENVQGTFKTLAGLVSEPFGLESGILKMFSSDVDIEGIASNFAAVNRLVRDAYSVLTDPDVVGAKKARRNARQMRTYLAQIKTLAAEAIAVRQQYDANLQAIADLESAYQDEVAGINARYNDLEKAGQDNLKRLQDALTDTTGAYEEQNRVLQSLISERDTFVSRMSDGFRSFVNDFARDADRGASVVERSTRKLANGITVTMEREIASGGASGLRGALESRLAEIRAFSTNIRTLMERGLDPALVRDFVSAGVQSAGSTVAALTSASDEDLQAINSVQVALAREAAEFGDYVSDAWFNAGIAAQAAIVSPLEQAVTDAQAAVNAARAYLDLIAAEREAALTQAANTFETEKARLEAENEALMQRAHEIAAEIEAIIVELSNKLPIKTAQAGQDAVTKMIEGFRKKFPEMQDKFGKLMDRLAASMNRTATVMVRTVYAGDEAPLKFGGKRALGGPVLSDRAYLVGERGPELFLPGANGNIVPNSLISRVPNMAASPRGTTGSVINVTVNAGMGADGADVGRKVVDILRQYERRNGPIPIKVRA